MPGKILIIDDEDAIRFFAAYRLSQLGWQVHEASSGELALAWLQENSCDVMLLDLNLPGGADGLTVMRQARQQWPDIQIIIMTAYASVNSAVEAVRHGAFDYLQKPCQIEEIVTCVDRAVAEKKAFEEQRRLARQASKLAGEALPELPNVVKTGQLVVEIGAHSVFWAGERLSLTPTEYALLDVLAQSLGEAVSLDQLIKDGLGYDTFDTQTQETLRVHISRLRRKLSNGYVLTIRGGGYALANINPV